MQKTFIGDARVREIEPLEFGERGQLQHLGVVDPGVPRLNRDDLPAASCSILPPSARIHSASAARVGMRRRSRAKRCV